MLALLQGLEEKSSPDSLKSIIVAMIIEQKNKRIAIFLDGTWNEVRNNTNVWRLKSLCDVGASQVVFYSQGVGTQFGTKYSGGMLGKGLDEEVVQAYEWLVEHYNEGDEIFIFGFSRGAYTARSLSGFISKCGLLKLGSPLGVGELYERYGKGSVLRTIRELARDLKAYPDMSLELEEKWLLDYSMAIPIKFIGVWDTVGALGIPFGKIHGWSRSSFDYLETDLHINNKYAYHALAIDEHRPPFAPTLWTRTIPKNVKPEEIDPPLRLLQHVEQRWFAGAHANVGGGYSADLLAQIPLKWIMGKALSHGLAMKGQVQLVGNEYLADVVDSFKGFYGRFSAFFSRYYRPIGVPPVNIDSENEHITVNETIDESVFERWRKVPEYRPSNLHDWAKRYQVNIWDLQKTVRADRPDDPTN